MSNKKLSVWWVPQVPMKAFRVDVSSVAEGVKIMDVLADYDMFQYDNQVKGDYCNAGGLNEWSENSDGEGTPGWVDWFDDETFHDDPREWLAEQEQNK